MKLACTVYVKDSSIRVCIEADVKCCVICRLTKVVNVLNITESHNRECLMNSLHLSVVVIRAYTSSLLLMCAMCDFSSVLLKNVSPLFTQRTLYMRPLFFDFMKCNGNCKTATNFRKYFIILYQKLN